MWNWITYLEREKKIILIKIYDFGIVFDNFLNISLIFRGDRSVNASHGNDREHLFELNYFQQLGLFVKPFKTSSVACGIRMFINHWLWRNMWTLRYQMNFRENFLETPNAVKGETFTKWQKHKKKLSEGNNKIYRFRFRDIFGQRLVRETCCCRVFAPESKTRTFAFSAQSTFITFCCLFLLAVILMLWYHAGLRAVSSRVGNWNGFFSVYVNWKELIAHCLEISERIY